MTRVNCIPVQELTRQHLQAEYREILRFRHTYPRTSPPSIPPEYVLGKGHVTFFFDKGTYLLKRHADLVAEMQRRGFQTNFTLDLSNWPENAMNDWHPTEDAIRINKQRIEERNSKSKGAIP